MRGRRKSCGPGDIGSPRIYEPSVPHLLMWGRCAARVIYGLVGSEAVYPPSLEVSIGLGGEGKDSWGGSGPGLAV